LGKPPNTTNKASRQRFKLYSHSTKITAQHYSVGSHFKLNTRKVYKENNATLESEDDVKQPRI